MNESMTPRTDDESFIADEATIGSRVCRAWVMQELESDLAAALARADAAEAMVLELTKRGPTQFSASMDESMDEFLDDPKRIATLKTTHPAAIVRGLCRRVNAAEADARRYRWLRHLTYGERTPDGEQTFVLPDPVPVENIMRGSVSQHLDAAIDAAIDAAMKEHGNG